MDHELQVLCLAAVTIALVHTVCGPDHYVPFVAMARVGRWTMRRSILVTLACGVAHVGSSVLLGCAGILLGTAMARLEMFEAVRGNVAGWLLIGFGLIYTIWALVRTYRRRPHAHLHVRPDGSVYCHHHGPSDSEQGQHVHAKSAGSPAELPASASSQMTAWALFTIFIFGPCEPLIPLLMYPAARSSYWGAALVASLFAVVTMATMVGLVVVLARGMELMRLGWLERHHHVMAGIVVTICGVAVNFGF